MHLDGCSFEGKFTLLPERNWYDQRKNPVTLEDILNFSDLLRHPQDREVPGGRSVTDYPG
jgi:hypothetical protein